MEQDRPADQPADHPANHASGHWLDDTFQGIAEGFERRHHGPKITSIIVHALIFCESEMVFLEPPTAPSGEVYSHTLKLNDSGHFGPMIPPEYPMTTLKPLRVMDYVLEKMLRAVIKKDQCTHMQFLDFLYQMPVRELTTKTLKNGSEQRTLHLCVSLTVFEYSTILTLRRNGANEDVAAALHLPHDEKDLTVLGADPLPGIVAASFQRYLDATRDHLTTQLFSTAPKLMSIMRAMFIGCLRVREVATGKKLEYFLICLKNADPDLGFFLVAVSRARFGKRDGGLFQRGEERFNILAREKLESGVRFTVDSWNHRDLSKFIRDGGRLEVQWVDNDG